MACELAVKAKLMLYCLLIYFTYLGQCGAVQCSTHSCTGSRCSSTCRLFRPPPWLADIALALTLLPHSLVSSSFYLYTTHHPSAQRSSLPVYSVLTYLQTCAYLNKLQHSHWAAAAAGISWWDDDSVSGTVSRSVAQITIQQLLRQSTETLHPSKAVAGHALRTVCVESTGSIQLLRLLTSFLTISPEYGAVPPDRLVSWPSDTTWYMMIHSTAGESASLI